MELKLKLLMFELSCRDCFKPGYQPFANASGLEFWVKQDDDSGQVQRGGGGLLLGTDYITGTSENNKMQRGYLVSWQ